MCQYPGYKHRQIRHRDLRPDSHDISNTNPGYDFDYRSGHQRQED